MSDEESVLPSDASKYVDVSIFEQILEMDEDENDREFSSSLVFGFFDQAESTFTDMEKKIESKDLVGLGQLGHFLKGSSATLGLFRVQESCEKIQNWGAGKDETGENRLDDNDLCLKKIKEIMPRLKADFYQVKDWLEKFFATS